MNPLKSLYAQIIESNPKLHGWATIEKAITLANLIVATRPKVVLEIGVWGGRSFIPMALACKRIGHGTVIGVDPWDASISAAGQVTEPDKKWWSEQNHELVYQSFLYHLNRFDLGRWSEIHRMRSDDFNGLTELNLLHLDGNHGPQAVTDIKHFGPMISDCGLCVLDDTNWTGESVANAGQWLLDNGFVELHPLGTGKVYMKKP